MNRSAAIAPTNVEIAERTRRQITARLLPFLFILYITNYIDRTSVAYAALGMTHDLGFSDRVFGLGAGIFFVSYVALQIPGAMLVEHWSARRLISAVMIAWGSLTALTGLVHTAHQLYFARLALGAAEAAFFPGVIVYLSHWFSREDRAKATGYFMSAIPLSQALASPVAGWIVGHSFLGLQGWRWLFILEGAPAIVLGAIAYFFLNDWPREADWLAPAQREWIEQKLHREKLATPHAMPVVHALRSPIVLLLAVVAFLQYFVGYGFYFWFPTMLKRVSTLSDFGVGLVGMIPYLLMFVAMIANGWHSDKKMERRWHSAVPVFIAALGALGLMAHSSSLAVSVTFFCMIACANAFLSTFWAIPTTLLSRSAAAGAVGFINAVASVAGFAAPYLLGYLSTRTGSFSSGMAAVAVAAVAGALLIFRIPKTKPAPAV
ncbi:MAG TPA: MFS transporter [Candidatus Acidoferrales bacterium]|nr:MFS transporter [Candidatus Acidoferrales bacterium]